MMTGTAEGFATEQVHFTISHKKQDQTIAEIHGLSGNLHGP